MALVLRGLRPLWTRGVLPATSASRKNAHSTDASGKIYEMRRYKIQPAKFTEYLRIASEKYEEVMTPHGKLVGYWASNMGSLNEVQHLWEYGEREVPTYIFCSHSVNPVFFLENMKIFYLL